MQRLIHFLDNKMLDDILFIVCSYVGSDSMLEDEQFSSYVYTVKKLYLNTEDSLKYYNGKLNVSKRIKYPKKQLCLDLCNSNIRIAKSVTAYSIDLSFNTNLVDVSALKNVPVLNLSYCEKLVDVSMLGNVQSLNLSFCKNVTDFSALGTVPILNLRGCNICDVFPLRNVQNLNLSECFYIKDFSSLKNVTVLDLSETEISDVSFLKDVKALYLRYCRNVKSVSGLTAKILELNGCKISDISNINPHTLNISLCANIKDVSFLSPETLIVFGCKNLKYSSNLEKIPKLIGYDLKNKKIL